MVVIAIISVMLVAVIPAVTSLSKSSGRKSAISNLMNALEQARSLALTSGSATYVVFADQSTPENYRCKAFIIFQDNKDFYQTAVTKWHFLPTGISFRPDKGLVTRPSGSTPLRFVCPGTMGASPLVLPYVKFDPNGIVAAPTDPNILFLDLFAGSVDTAGEMSYTDSNQRMSGKYDAVVLARFTGRARYVDPYSSS
jgi:type II secretory pathway pseudopilin PulG